VGGDRKISEATFHALDAKLEIYANPDETFAQLGASKLIEILRQNDPELAFKLEDDRHKLDQDPGFFIVKNTGIERVESPVAQLGAITLSCMFGTPTQTTPRSPVIAWPVTYKPKSENVRKTFSETNSEASLHTDSQYLAEPEHYFGLFCIKPDQFGGGASQIVDGNAVIDQLRGTRGETVLCELGKLYPFRLPSVFTKDDGDLDAEVIWAPILSANRVRYRHDTLMSALDLDHVEIPDSQLEAISAFEEVLHEIRVDEYSLEAGDVMFVNNYRMLHGRTAFEDSKRFLYRVRMN